MHIFHMTSGFKRTNISRNTRWNCNFFFAFKKFTSQASRDPKFTPKTRTKQSIGLEYFISAILFRTSQVNNVWVLKLL